MRGIFESARAAGVDLVLDLFEIESASPPPILRAALRGWVGYPDGISLDRPAYRDVPVEDVVQLSIDTLIAALQGVEGRHSDISAMLKELNRAAQPAESGRLGPTRDRAESTRAGPTRDRAESTRAGPTVRGRVRRRYSVAGAMRWSCLRS
ncbi:hypothetical protein [Embleya sp. NPDC001921]